MLLREVQTSRDLNRFVSLPWKLYKDDPNWVPPLKWEVKEFLDPKKHPFYQHGTAAKFLLYDGNEPIGRILVADDPRFNAENGTQVGTFGFFECIDSREAAETLLNAARDWSRRHGRTTLMGPIDYSTNYNCGLLIEGFETPPRIMMSHHLPYYQRLIEANGFQKNKDLYAWWFDDSLEILDKWKAGIERISKRSKVIIRPFSRKNFQEDVKRCLQIYDDARNDWWWSCVSLTPEEIEYFVKQLSFFGDENLVYIAEKAGQPIGFSITMPDVNEAIKPLNGNLFRFGLPIGMIRLWRNVRKIKTARMMVLCVLPPYRKQGIAERLIMQTLDYGKNTARFTGGELGWIDESNQEITRVLERVGAKRYKTYRVYEKSTD